MHSDHYRQVLLYMILLDQVRLAAVDRWLPYTVTTIDRLLYMILLDQVRLAAVDRWLPCTVTTIDRFYCT